MPQVLYVKSQDGKSTIPVQILRSFSDSAGQSVFLHMNGTYGDKLGSPVKSLADLQSLPEPHRSRAISWWERIGRKQSEEHYKKIAEADAARAGDFQEALAADEFNSELDCLLYTRRTIENGKKGPAASAPKSWMECGFSTRPDWWGQAASIAFKDFAYEILPAGGAVPEK